MNKYKQSIKAIENNYPPEKYSALREALDLSIYLLKQEDDKLERNENSENKNRHYKS